MITAIINFFLDSSSDLLGLMNIPSKVSDFVIISVFYKFVYEIRLVVLKLDSDGPQDFKAKLKRQRIIWTLIYLILSINLFLSIF